MFPFKFKEKDKILQRIGKLPKGYFVSFDERGQLGLMRFNTPRGLDLGVLLFDATGSLDAIHTDCIYDEVVLNGLLKLFYATEENGDLLQYIEQKGLGKKGYLDTLGLTKKKENEGYYLPTYSKGALRVCYGDLGIIYNTEYCLDLFLNFYVLKSLEFKDTLEKENNDLDISKTKKSKLNIEE